MSLKRCIKAKPKVIVISVLGTVTLLGLIAGIIVWQVVDWDKDSEPEDDYFLEPSDSKMGRYSKAAISTDAPLCSDIGKQMLERNGTVVDAAIAASLCVGLIQAQSMGIGGGFLAIYYNAATGKSRALNARERAPYQASENMFDGDPEKSSRGPLAVGVPGELKGYWELYKAYGSLPWKDLFEPTIKLAENGFPVTAHAANAMSTNRVRILATPSLREILVNNATGQVWKEVDIMKRPTLAKTLTTIANWPEEEDKDILYQNTQLMKDFVDDLQNMGGLVTEKDMLDYTATWEDSPVVVNLSGNLTLHSVPPPGSGILLGFVLQLLSKYENRSETLLSSQRLTEAFKHVYARRTLLGDPEDHEVADQVAELRKNLTESADYIDTILNMIHEDRTNNTYEYYGAEYYQPNDHGTSHLSIIAPNGDAIALTSTVNLYYGAMIRSQRTGIIYNDQMDDFSSPNVTNAFGVPPSVNNFIRPHKRPVSSMAPAIFTDGKGKVRLVIGAAGGTKITTAITTVAMKNLWFDETIKEAIDGRRLHHQLYPMEVQYEEGFNPRIITGLEKIGHTVDMYGVGSSVVQAVAVAENGTIYVNADFRKNGTIAGF